MQVIPERYDNDEGELAYHHQAQPTSGSVFLHTGGWHEVACPTNFQTSAGSQVGVSREFAIKGQIYKNRSSRGSWRHGEATRQLFQQPFLLPRWGLNPNFLGSKRLLFLQHEHFLL